MFNAASRAGRFAVPNRDRKSTRLNSSHQIISYAVFCLKKKKNAAESRRHGEMLFANTCDMTPHKIRVSQTSESLQHKLHWQVNTPRTLPIGPLLHPPAR